MWTWNPRWTGLKGWLLTANLGELRAALEVFIDTRIGQC